MNHQALLHIPDSNYCYAVDTNTVEILLRTDKNDKFDEINIIYGNKYDYYVNQKRASLSLRFSDTLFDYYFIRLKLDDVRFVYIFELNTGDSVYYFSEDGVTEKYDFSLAYFNSFQLPYINEADVTQPVDWLRNGIFYQIFVDRFYCGNREKNMSYVNAEWGDKPTPNSFFGGDIDGIIKKLDYIQNLGCDTLYLTPVFKSKTNHKYNITDYYKIDEQFGGNNALKRLVEAVHSKGMRIILDAVFNHCDKSLKEFQDVIKKGKKSRFYDWFIIHGDKADTTAGNYEYFGVCKYMPKFNTSNQKAQKYLTDIALYWIKKYNIDGWRLDVADEVSHDFWRKFRVAVKNVKRDAVIIGENWHDAHPYLNGDQFDGIMNYSVTKAMTDYFAKKNIKAKGLSERLSALYVRNSRPVNNMMLNLLDSHDTHRFYTMVNENENALIAALSVIFCLCGSACIYYGTEIPLAGGYDPDCRRTMDWTKENDFGAAGRIIKSLAELKKTPVIKYGEIYYEYAENVFILKRVYNGEVLKLTVLNEGSAEIKAENVLLSHNYDGSVLFGAGFIIEGVKS